MAETNPHPSEYVRVKFMVRANTSDGDVVGIVGSVPELGLWDTSRVVHLVASDMEPRLWTVALPLPTVEMHYKYVILNKEGALVQWESLRGANRKVKPTGIEETVDDGEFGRALNTKRTYIDEGWLSPENGFEVRMYMGLTKEPSVRFSKPDLEEVAQKHGLKIRMNVINAECEPYEKTFDVALHRWLGEVEKANYRAIRTASKTEHKRQRAEIHLSDDEEELSPHESSVLTLRDEEADCYLPGDMVVFTTRIKSLQLLERMGVSIHFYSTGNYAEGEAPVPPNTLIGKAVILSSMMSKFDPLNPEHRNSSGMPDGVIVSPIFGSELKCVGELVCKYLIITPLAHPNNNLSKSWRSYWRSQNRTLDVGHRGMGKTHTDDVAFTKEVPENTIGSIIAAARLGADMVEFDVQLTRDEVPVLHHDVTRGLVVQRDKDTYADVQVSPEHDITSVVETHLKDETEDEHYEEDLIYLDISQLTLKQWRQLKTRAATDQPHSANLFTPLSASGKLRRLLEQIPKLEDCLKIVPEHLGFNIEIKYPEKRVDYANYFEKNFYVDTILKVILDHGGSRQIVISSFDADVCTLVRLKQPIYPVFFLTHGDTSNDPPFNDKRWHSTRYGVIFAKSERMLGIVHKSTTLVQQPSLIPAIKNEGLVLFTWGEENNEPENVTMQRQLGVDAVIVDNFRRHMSSTRLSSATNE